MFSVAAVVCCFSHSCFSQYRCVYAILQFVLPFSGFICPLVSPHYPLHRSKIAEQYSDFTVVQHALLFVMTGVLTQEISNELILILITEL